MLMYMRLMGNKTYCYLPGDAGVNKRRIQSDGERKQKGTVYV